MRRLVAERGLDWEVDSAGTGDWHAGEPPDARAIQVAKHYGTNISNLRARQFVQADFDRFDKIYAMDLKNLRDVLAQARTDDDRNKVQLFLEAAFPSRREGVKDPWYGDHLFDPVYHEIHAACEHILQTLIAQRR